MDKKTYIIIGILSGVLILIIIMTYVLLRAQNTPPTTDSSLTPSPLTPEVSVTPVDFTGVREEQISSEEANQVDQERTLRKSLPYQGQLFLVSYDNYDDAFFVQLNEPKDAARTNFNIWRAENASALPESRFVIQ